MIQCKECSQLTGIQCICFADIQIVDENNKVLSDTIDRGKRDLYCANELSPV